MNDNCCDNDGIDPRQEARAEIGLSSVLVNMQGTIYCKSWADAKAWCNWAVEHRRPFYLSAPSNEIGYRFETVLANDETIQSNMIVPK